MPGLGQTLHVLGADLDLDLDALGADQGGVEGLVAVGLGDGDVVLEASGDRLVEIVDQSQYPITGIDPIDRHPEGEDVGQFGEAARLVAHLAIDAVEMFLTPLDPTLDAFLLQGMAQRRLDQAHHLDPCSAAASLERTLDDPSSPRPVVRETQILQLDADPVDPEPIGDRGEDVERLARDAPAGLRTHRVERAHVVQPVGELDQDDADVARHRQQHLLQARGLRLGARLEVELGELADPIDQLGDLLAEGLGQLRLVDRGVLDDVVQQRGDQTLVVHAHLGQDARNRQRVIDIGLARLALLALVRFGAEQIGVVARLDLIRRQIAGQIVAEVADQIARITRQPGRFDRRRPVQWSECLNLLDGRVRADRARLGQRGRTSVGGGLVSPWHPFRIPRRRPRAWRRLRIPEPAPVPEPPPCRPFRAGPPGSWRW
jgi:hypothetical protein